MTAEATNRRAFVLLALGSIVGICLGVVSALTDNVAPPPLPKDAVAVVNGKSIRTEEYNRAVAMLASDKRNALTDGDRVHVLNRLIEEELLIQHGVKHGLIDTHHAVRQTITQAMLASVVTESASEQPTQEALQTFYQDNPSLFEQSAVQGANQAPVTRLPAFEEVQHQVEELYLQQAKDEALREYLAWLRDEAEIVLTAGEEK